VAPRPAVTQMMREADEVVVLASPAAFRSVGEWYASFAQLTDGDVLSLLAQARASTPEPEAGQDAGPRTKSPPRPGGGGGD